MKAKYEIHEEPGMGFGARVKTGGTEAHLGYHPTREEAQGAIDRHKNAEAYWKDYTSRHERAKPTESQVSQRPKKEKPSVGGEPPPVNIYGRF